MTYNMTKFLHYDGTTTSDIMPSLVRFECVNGVFPEMGGLTVVLTGQVLDVDGNAVTIDKGDALWPYFYQASPIGMACPMAGYVTDIKREGDTLTITAESLATPLLRSTFTGTYTANPYAYSILKDIVDGYTPPISHEVYQFFAVYRPAYGAAQIPIDARIDEVSFDKTQVAAIYQYFSEFPAIASLANVLSAACADYYTQEIGAQWTPGLGIQWSGYGNHPSAAVQLTYDNYLLSMVQWKDSTESILNDITIKTKGTGLYQKTDAASIAAYGQRATTLYRPMYTDVTYAQVHADTMVAALKDPKVRCSATLDANVLFPYTATGLNWVFQIVDDVAGRTEDVVLSKFTFRWPEMIAECEFDNAAISLNRAGVRMDNRVTNLEAAVPDQDLNTTSSPSFASANITGAITTGQGSTFDRWQFSGVRDLVYNGKRAMVMREDWAPTTLVINYGGDFGQVNIASPLVVSGNIKAGLTGGYIGLGHGIRTADRAELHLNSIGDNPSEINFGVDTYNLLNIKWQISSRTAAEGDNLEIYVGPKLSGWIKKFTFTKGGAFTLNDTSAGMLEVPYIRFNKGSEVFICNTGGTINFVSNWANTAWQSIKCGAINSVGGRFDLSGSAPLFYFAETDQTLPAGRWRMGVDGDTLLIDHNTASDGLYGTKQRAIFNSNGFYCYGVVSGAGNKCFSAFLGSNTNISAATETIVKFGSTKYNNGTCYSTSTGVFTAPYAGRYQINAQVNFVSMDPGKRGRIKLTNNSTTTYADSGDIYNAASFAAPAVCKISVILDLAANASVAVSAYTNSDTAEPMLGNTSILYSYFQAEYLGA